MSNFRLSLPSYVERLRKAVDKEAEIGCVLKEIDENFFCSTEKHLSKDEKISIINCFQTYFRREIERKINESTDKVLPCYKYLPPDGILYFTDNSKILDALEKTKLKIGV